MRIFLLFCYFEILIDLNLERDVRIIILFDCEESVNKFKKFINLDDVFILGDYEFDVLLI